MYMKKTHFLIEIPMVIISFLIYLNERIINTPIFWHDYPSYKKWLSNRKRTLRGVSVAIMTTLYFVNLYVFFMYLGIHIFVTISKKK
jgi:hypothetical protein